MKKSKKIMLRIIPVILVLMVMFTTTVFANSPISPDLRPGSEKIDSVSSVANKVWGTVSLLLQIAAIGAMIFAGVRYMFASANEKANIKGQLVWLAVGAAIVFGATSIIKFIQRVTTDVVG